jgi:hypothetical protein
MNPRVTVGGLALIGTAMFALAPLYRRGVEIPISQHHLFHAAILAGAAISGILFAGVAPRGRPGSPLWLVVAMVTPIIAMFLMLPSEYAYFELHAYGHVGEHFGLMFCGFVAGYAGERYASGVGWATGFSVFAMAVLAIWGYGVAPVIAR